MIFHTQGSRDAKVGETSSFQIDFECGKRETLTNPGRAIHNEEDYRPDPDDKWFYFKV